MDVTPELVLAQWAAGMSSVLFLVTRWRATSPGYAWLVSGVAAGFAFLAWAAGGRAEPLLAIAGAAGLVSIAVAVAKWRPAQDMLEAVAAAVGIAALGFVAAQSAGEVPEAASVVRALAGAAFLGAVTDEMALGHWYLIDPKLPKTAIERLNRISLGSLAAMVLVVIVPPSGIFSSLESSRLTVLAWVALCAFSALLLVLVGRALREPGYASVMSATGLSYVATMVAVGAVVVAWMAVEGSFTTHVMGGSGHRMGV